MGDITRNSDKKQTFQISKLQWKMMTNRLTSRRLLAISFAALKSLEWKYSYSRIHIVLSSNPTSSKIFGQPTNTRIFQVGLVR